MVCWCRSSHSCGLLRKGCKAHHVSFTWLLLHVIQMENIGTFLSGCEDYGLKKTDLFQTVDLYEEQNIPQVIATIHALGRQVSRERILPTCSRAVGAELCAFHQYLSRLPVSLSCPSV